MKQFLRFQISGLTCLAWVMLYLLPYINWPHIDINNGKKTVIALLGSVAFALPLGTIIHQVSISILSPFRKYRVLNVRTSSKPENINKIADKLMGSYKDKKRSAAMVFASAIKTTYKKSDEFESELDVQYIRQEISNRYSYYYVRVDNGLIAPALAYGIYYILKQCLASANPDLILKDPTASYFIMPIIAIGYAVLMLMYIPALLREVDDLEKLLLNPKIFSSFLEKNEDNPD